MCLGCEYPTKEETVKTIYGSVAVLSMHIVTEFKSTYLH